jgi:hypothetical protein
LERSTKNGSEPQKDACPSRLSMAALSSQNP